jgi:hypothetical protein
VRASAPPSFEFRFHSTISLNGRIYFTPARPKLRTYLYPGDVTSRRRFALLALVVAGGLATWLGPTLGLLVVDPLIWLGLAEQAVLTADSDCLDPRVAASVAQPCAADVHVDYFFWNLTNADAWRAGAAPPAYEEVGPYAFAAREARYGVEFSDDWTEVEYTFHQWADFLPEKVRRRGRWLRLLGCCFAH